MASLESIDVQFVNYSDSDSCWNKDYAYLSINKNFDIQEFSFNMIRLGICALLLVVPTLGEKYATDYPTTWYPTEYPTTLNPCPYSLIGPTTKATNQA